MSASLVIERLSKTYPNGTKALDSISMEIPCGMYGLLGPNGAGKSTLMRTIATLQEPDSGSIRLGDLDVLKQKDEVRRRLGYLPQEFGVYPRVSAEDMLDHLAFGMSSVRFICGTSTVHKEFEGKLSKFLDKEDTILYPSCFDRYTLRGCENAFVFARTGFVDRCEYLFGG